MVDDVEQDGSVFQIASTPEQLQAVRQAVEGAGFTVESAELSMVPKVTVGSSAASIGPCWGQMVRVSQRF